jgi:hypothetical protein
MSKGDMFSRWSDRKRKVATEQTEPETDAPEEQVAVQGADETEAELLVRLKLPDPDSLGAGDDFSVFMSKRVPEFLRRRALRRLWRSNPVLANVDGLNDYDDDFRSPELTQKVLKTAYQVGKGIVRVIEPKEPVIVIEEDDQLPEPETSEPAQISDLQDEAEVEVASGQADTTSIDEPHPAFRPRRMRFDT